MFYFFLAEKLGMTVGMLLAGIGSRELTEWQCYYRIIDEKMKESKEDKGNLGNKVKAMFSKFKKEK